MFMIVEPQAWQGWKYSELPEEEDLAGVDYRGEDDETMKIFEEMGIMNTPTPPTDG